MTGQKHVAMIQYDTPSEKQHRFPYVRSLVRAIRIEQHMRNMQSMQGSSTLGAGTFDISMNVHTYRADTTLLLYSRTSIVDTRINKDISEDVRTDATQGSKYAKAAKAEGAMRKCSLLSLSDDSRNDDASDESYEGTYDESDEEFDKASDQSPPPRSQPSHHITARGGLSAAQALLPLGQAQALHPVPYPDYNSDLTYGGKVLFKKPPRTTLANAPNAADSINAAKIWSDERDMDERHQLLVVNALLHGLSLLGETRGAQGDAEGFTLRTLTALMYATAAGDTNKSDTRSGGSVGGRGDAADREQSVKAVLARDPSLPSVRLHRSELAQM